MKNLSLNLLFICLITANLLGDNHFSKLNPDFVNYIKSEKEASNFGAVPPPIISKYRNLNTLKKSTVLPNVYDLRDSNWVSPVKNQGGCGSCWTFSTMATIESNWLKNGYGEFDLSENNLKNGAGTLLGPCDGGNAFMSTGYFARALGPVLEIDDPYKEFNETYYKFQTPFYISEAQFFPAQIYYNSNEAELENYITAVKNSILENGAHHTLYFHSDNYLEWINGNLTYYYPEDGTSNHAVTIIGWNDTLTTACAKKGAWLIKNSWSEEWGMDGFYYISYYDKIVNLELCYWPKRIDYSEENFIYSLDEYGGYLYFKDGINSTMYGLMKAELWNQDITKVSTWTNGNNSNLFVEVYDNFENNILTDLLGSGNLTSIENQGFYNIDLDSTVRIKGKNEVFIKVTYENAPDDTNSVIPIETAYPGFIDPIISVGTDWISSDGVTWDNTYDELMDLSIKLFGKYNGLQADFSVSKATPGSQDTIQFFDKTIGVEPSIEWLWDFGDSTYSMEKNPFHSYDSSGIYTVKLTVKSENFTENIIKESLIMVNDARLLLPENNTRQLTTEPEIMFDQISFAGNWKYSMIVADDRNLTKNLFTLSLDTISRFIPQDIFADNHEYFWTIVATDSTNEICYNDTNSFVINVEDEAPTEFALKIPKNGASNIGTKVGFLWEESVDNDPYNFVLYNLKVDTTSGFANPLYNIDSIAEYHLILPDDLANNCKYFWQVTAFDNTGLITVSTVDSFVVGSITAIDNVYLPTTFELSQNYPNPFNPTTNIRYSLSEKSNVELTVYNALGEKIETLENSVQSVGTYQITWQADAHPSGLYFYVLKCRSSNGKIIFHDMKKMLLIK